MAYLKTIVLHGKLDINRAYNLAIEMYSLEQSFFGETRLLYIKFDREKKLYECVFQFAEHENHDGTPDFTE